MAAHHLIVSSIFLFSVFFSLSASLSCHKMLPVRVLSGNSTWKLCVVSMNGAKLRFKIKNLFAPGNSGWLTIGFPHVDKADHVPFFLLEVNKFSSVKQTQDVKKEVNCSIPAGKRGLKVIPVDCVFKKAMSEYVNGKKIKVFWRAGGLPADTVQEEGKQLLKNHSMLYLYPRNKKNEPPAYAGSTAMRLLRNYGKSMAIIFVISFALTALITLTICCCCRKKVPQGFSKQKLTKDSSVSFYRDDSEHEAADGQSQSDESENDEKVAFLRNNNDRDSSV
ncbi:uncharacterized protein LOC114531897 [Dendronephthya gigantea]|uniref:uncharacterized protein LOC114531897 n=1 Tax=Dendronephthya gigantea TaxID=151771 RepID=UPI00106A390E|nr:uncharacterized protein LOC114531897 [Dendronephthya gigantea]